MIFIQKKEVKYKILVKWKGIHLKGLHYYIYLQLFTMDITLLQCDIHT